KFECKNVTNKTGYGLSADIEGNRYYIGSIRYIMENTSALTNNNISLVEEDYSLVMLANEKDI
ncbi:MAG: hypothetical protein GTO02_14470, partial [Candidatus Dadabacteria bacterium]|nr:hypothetical protein [Candidatus Dadabacteria bacterium]